MSMNLNTEKCMTKKETSFMKFVNFYINRRKSGESKFRYQIDVILMERLNFRIEKCIGQLKLVTISCWFIEFGKDGQCTFQRSGPMPSSSIIHKCC